MYTSNRIWAAADPVRRQRLVLLAHQRVEPGPIGCGLSAAAALGLPLPEVPLVAPAPIPRPHMYPRAKGERLTRLRSGVRLTRVPEVVISGQKGLLGTSLAMISEE